MNYKKDFERKVSQNYDKFDELKADILAFTLVVFMIGCFFYEGWDDIANWAIRLIGF